MINRSGSRGGVQGDDLRLSKIRSILPKKEKRETRLKSFLYGAPPSPPQERSAPGKTKTDEKEKGQTNNRSVNNPYLQSIS